MHDPDMRRKLTEIGSYRRWSSWTQAVKGISLSARRQAAAALVFPNRRLPDLPRFSDQVDLDLSDAESDHESDGNVLNATTQEEQSTAWTQLQELRQRRGDLRFCLF